MFIQQLYTNCLAEAAYYIESNGEAAIIDPIRDTTSYVEMAAARGAKIVYVFETHFHADFVSGHIDLAARTGAKIIYGPQATTAYEVYNAQDGEEFSLGELTIRAIHTPGHTPESTSYLLLTADKKNHAIFTGDTLFVGDVGRPDLLDGVMTKEELAGMMYDSLRNKIMTLEDEVMVYPAHGPGSQCGKNLGKETFSTIGEQKRSNYALQPMTKSEFINILTSDLSAPPMYFFTDAQINKKGYTSLESVLSRNLKPFSVMDFLEELEKGVTILDTRTADNFSAGFIRGAINVGLDGMFAIWVGTLIPAHTKLILVTENGKEEESVLRLARVGYDNVIGYLAGGMEAWKAAGENVEVIANVEPQDIVHLPEQGYEILDVRRMGEFEGAHLEGAGHLCLSKIYEKAHTLDANKKYAIHCAGGYRSMIAASILHEKGIKNMVNVRGGFAKIKNVEGVKTVISNQ